MNGTKFFYWEIDYSRSDKAELKSIIERSFSISELKSLCFDLDLDYESLEGTKKEEKILELIRHLDRRNELQELVKGLDKVRNGILPDRFTLSEHLLANLLPKLTDLSKEERDLFKLKLEGLNYRGISSRLRMAPDQAKYQTYLLIEKLNESSNHRFTLPGLRPYKNALLQIIGHDVVIVDSRPLIGSDGKVGQLFYDQFESVGDFLNEIYFSIGDIIDPFSYGSSWLVRDFKSGFVLPKPNTTWEKDKVKYDARKLQEVGIVPSMYLTIIPAEI